MGKSLIAGNRFHRAIAHFIAATPRFGGPKTVNAADLDCVEAFDKAIGKKCPLLARQCERLRCDLFNGHAHARRIPRTLKNLNSRRERHYRAFAAVTGPTVTGTNSFTTFASLGLMSRTLPSSPAAAASVPSDL